MSETTIVVEATNSKIAMNQDQSALEVPAPEATEKRVPDSLKEETSQNEVTVASAEQSDCDELASKSKAEIAFIKRVTSLEFGRQSPFKPGPEFSELKHVVMSDHVDKLNMSEILRKNMLKHGKLLQRREEEMRKFFGSKKRFKPNCGSKKSGLASQTKPVSSHSSKQEHSVGSSSKKNATDIPPQMAFSPIFTAIPAQGISARGPFPEMISRPSSPPINLMEIAFALKKESAQTSPQQAKQAFLAENSGDSDSSPKFTLVLPSSSKLTPTHGSSPKLTPAYGFPTKLTPASNSSPKLILDPDSLPKLIFAPGSPPKLTLAPGFSPKLISASDPTFKFEVNASFRDGKVSPKDQSTCIRQDWPKVELISTGFPPKSNPFSPPKSGTFSPPKSGTFSPPKSGTFNPFLVACRVSETSRSASQEKKAEKASTEEAVKAPTEDLAAAITETTAIEAPTEPAEGPIQVVPLEGPTEDGGDLTKSLSKLSLTEAKEESPEDKKEPSDAKSEE